MGKIGLEAKEVLVGISKLPKKFRPTNCELAQQLGVTEGSVRYHLRRIATGAKDGRKERYSRVSEWDEQIDQWADEQKKKSSESGKRDSVKMLHDMLVVHHNCDMSIDAVRRYVSRRFPELLEKPKRIRLETPPGMMSQVDWKEDISILFGGPGRSMRINLFVLSLPFSRGVAVIVRKNRDMQSFLSAHNEAWKRLGGIPRFERPDCMKTAVSRYRGKKGIEMNEMYRRHLAKVDCRPLPSRPGKPRDKGKVEKRIRDVMNSLSKRFDGHIFYTMKEIQEVVDTVVDEKSARWRSGATGLTVKDSLSYERTHLQPLPASLPQAPVKEQRRKVASDGTVYFMKNYYQVPEQACGRSVLCTFTGTEIVVTKNGVELTRKPYLPEASGMVVVSEEALLTTQKKFNPEVREMSLEVARRQVDYYEQITEHMHGS